MWALIFAALVTKSMEAGSSCVTYSCKKKIVDSNVKIQALKLVSTMKNIATLWTSRKDQKQEKTPKEPVDICWKTISCLLADSLQLVVSHKWTAGQ